MVKLGQGATDLHSARSQVDFTTLAALTTPLGIDSDFVQSANSVLEVVYAASDDQRRALAIAIANTAHNIAVKTLSDAPVTVEVMVVGRDGTCWATVGG